MLICFCAWALDLLPAALFVRSKLLIVAGAEAASSGGAVALQTGGLGLAMC
jgi:hypothetical protein